MRFAFTDEQDMFRDTVRELFAREAPPEAVRASWDTADGRVGGLWTTLAEVGVLAVRAPESCGGLGMDEVDLVRLLEESGYGAVPDPLVEHVGVAVPALAEGGAAELATRAATGDVSCTVALAIGGRHVVGAATADYLVFEHDAQLMVTPGHAVTMRSPVRSIDGGRRIGEVDIDLHQALPLDGADVDLASDRAVLGTAAQCIGVGRRLLDETVAYVAQRHQFGKPVGSYQAVKHHLADVRLGLEFAAPLVYRAAWSVARPESHDPIERRRDVSMAKAMAADAVDRACRAALQCHGAIGYTFEYDLQLWLKRGWVLSAAYGDARFHRDQVAASLGLMTL